MTVTTTTTRHSFNGTGVSFSSGGTQVGHGPHNIQFTIIDASHIQVYWTKGTGTVGTPISSGDFTAGSSGYLVKDVHYTVQNAGTTSNATITWREAGFTVGSTVIYPTNADTVVVTRNVPLTQSTNYQNNASIDAETIESSFDKLVQTAQQLNDDKDYSFRFASTLTGSTGFNSTAGTASTLNVNKADRISKALKFDSNGDIGVSTYDPDTFASSAEASATSASASATLAGNYATKIDGVVTGSDHSSKAWAIGGTGVTDTSSKGASKEWAIETSGTVDTSEYSAKEYAQGTQASTGGSSKSWAQDTDQVNGAGTNDRSAKSWSQGASMTGSTLGGSAKDWAQLAEDSQVNGSEYSAKHYSAKASASATSASDSATASQANSIVFAIALG